MKTTGLTKFFILAPSSYTVKEEEVTFHLRTRGQQEIQITDALIETIDPTKPFHFLIHGWMDSHTTAWCVDLAAAYLNRCDCNLVLVDWQAPSSQYHYIAANNTKGAGRFLGRFIVKLAREISVPLPNVHIVGHSFGAHVAAFAGKEVAQRLGERVGRITALDPARRPFENSVSAGRGDTLFDGDAAVVVAVHSDAGLRGFLGPVGTVDFYPNGGGAPQPGCEGVSDIHGCGHNLSPRFFVEAVENPGGFLSVRCGSYEEYVSGSCGDNDKVALGGDVEEHEGTFYFETNPQYPYSKN